MQTASNIARLKGLDSAPYDEARERLHEQFPLMLNF
jgi:hypothetical protein